MKDYKKILEGVVNIINTTEKSDIGFVNICTYLDENCPELRESEDEKIKKEILDYIDKATGCKRWVAWLEKQGESIDKITQRARTEKQRVLLTETNGEANIDWNTRSIQDVKLLLEYGLDYIKKLENQGEQKPANKIEPKFKVGDWVIDKQGIVHQVANAVEIVSNHTYGYDIVGGGYFNDNAEGVRLWNIYDAMDGDILCTYECDEPKIVFILKGTPKKHYALSYHCYYNIMYPHFEDDSVKGCLAPNNEDVKPATKEQRDLLFQKMKEAGYEFDFDKKELKKIEDEEYDGDDYGIDSLWHAKNILEKTLGEVEGYQTDDGILDHKCAISFIDKLYKQKPAEWSEEDESNF